MSICIQVVRLINQLVKRRGDRLKPSALDCLLSLKIRDVDLDAEAEVQTKKKQDEKHKKRIVNLSKKEKKRAKKLKEVERELLETQAQESDISRRKQLTEVTKTVFHIYFRLLKTAPRSKLLAAALNGLAKFTHVINLEYYSDLVAILSRLTEDEFTIPGVRQAANMQKADHKLSPVQIFDQYDGSQMAFKPSIPPPKSAAPAKVPRPTRGLRPPLNSIASK